MLLSHTFLLFQKALKKSIQISIHTVYILIIETPKMISYCHENGIIGFYNAIMYLKDADELANSVDPDQTAP